MVVVVFIFLSFIFCTIALYIHLMNLTSYIVMMCLMILFYILRIYNDAKFKNSSREKKLRKIFNDCPMDSSFEDYLFSKYIYIIKSVSYNCLNEIKDKVTQPLYDEFVLDAEALKKLHHKNVLSDFKLLSIELTSLDKYYVEFTIRYKCIDYTLNRKDKIIRGSDEVRREYCYKIAFERDNDKKMILSYNNLIYQK